MQPKVREPQISFQELLETNKPAVTWTAATLHMLHIEGSKAHLVIAQPYSVVQEMEADHMVMEGLAFGVPPGGGKALREHLLHQLQMWLLIEGRIKAQDRSGSLEMVAA